MFYKFRQKNKIKSLIRERKSKGKRFLGYAEDAKLCGNKTDLEMYINIGMNIVDEIKHLKEELEKIK